MENTSASTVYGWLTQNPEIIAIVILVLGVALGRLAQYFLTKALAALDERWARQSTTGAVLLTPENIRFGGILLFWAIVLITIAMALSILDPESLRTGAALMATFAGRVAIAGLIVGAGHLLGLIAMAGAARLGAASQMHPAIPRLAYAAIMLVAAITALAQLAIDTSFVSQLLLILIGATAIALALAFASGARTYVENLLAGRELGRFSIGERIRVAEVEGTIVALHSTYAELETADGITCVPASQLAWHTVVRLAADG